MPSKDIPMSQSLPLYQIDAFTDRVFGGNPAAVCPLNVWLTDEVMQAIALENNLSETAYFVARDDGDFETPYVDGADSVTDGCVRRDQ